MHYAWIFGILLTYLEGNYDRITASQMLCNTLSAYQFRLKLIQFSAKETRIKKTVFAADHFETSLAT